ncbi:hypothetical protein BJY01DRAFT_217900 [Aspergillus pseudoustus]|uniref:Conidiation protein 6-domain-containing protein n=1 Tax=Aspergillus pseudoustus TaxID=1810923 RepID=A0ABR4JMW2_9EURO
MSQRKPSTVEAIRDARAEGYGQLHPTRATFGQGGEKDHLPNIRHITRLLQNPVTSETQKKKAQSMFSATKDTPEDPLAEPYQKLRESPGPAPTAAHQHRRLSEASRRMFARKMHEMGEEEPEELLLL